MSAGVGHTNTSGMFASEISRHINAHGVFAVPVHASSLRGPRVAVVARDVWFRNAWLRSQRRIGRRIDSALILQLRPQGWVSEVRLAEGWDVWVVKRRPEALPGVMHCAICSASSFVICWSVARASTPIASIPILHRMLARRCGSGCLCARLCAGCALALPTVRVQHGSMSGTSRLGTCS
jgi:hypothetical protein